MKVDTFLRNVGSLTGYNGSVSQKMASSIKVGMSPVELRVWS
jgi:hypothetical protein